MADSNTTWRDDLVYDDKNRLKKTVSNLRLILLNDEELQKVRFDTFAQDDVSYSALFHNVNGNNIDEESVGKIQDYLEQQYGVMLTQNKVFEILRTTARERSFNPVLEFIRKEGWDGVPRIERLLVDCLGAEDSPLCRQITKIWFTAAVARVVTPGIKFDNVLTLPGPQGIGKSSFFRAISGKWFSDSFSFASSDKEKVEAITSAWIVEISELNGMKRANDAEAAKAFLSRQSDSMRPAYGHKVQEFKRHNVFAATTNETNFLQGDNGNRRWWIVPVSGRGAVAEWLPRLKAMVPQIWAEALYYYEHEEPLYLPPELEAEANKVQNQHSNILNDPLLEDIELFLDREVPEQYAEWNIAQRLSYQQGFFPAPTGSKKVSIDMVCAQQIIRELPNDQIRRMAQKYTSNYVNKLMEQMPGWERSKQEKVRGLHPDYCDKTGRCKLPWVRVVASESTDDKQPQVTQLRLPF